MPTPSFYHIHDGFCRTLESRGIYVDATRFNANHNLPPDIFVKNPAYLIRNGDIRFHAEIFASLESVFTHLRPIGVLIPILKTSKIVPAI